MSQNIGVRVGMNDHPFKRKVKIYDVKTKELLYTCESMHEAKQISGVKSVSVYIQTKCRCYTNKLGRIICFR